MESTSSTIAASAAESDTGSLDSAAVATPWGADAATGSLDEFALVTNLHAAYVAAPPRTRRLINQALFEKFLITDDGEVTGELRAPFDLLLQAAVAAETRGDAQTPLPSKPRGPLGARGLSKQSLVGEKGLEPSRLAPLAPKASVSTNSTTRPSRGLTGVF